jgi:tRNA-specific 2-thiouridylase
MIGPPTLLDVDLIEGIKPIWAGRELGDDPVEVIAQVRAHGEPLPARACVRDGRLVVELHRCVRGLAPGQAVVVYDCSRVIGSATVDRTRRVVRA